MSIDVYLANRYWQEICRERERQDAKWGEQNHDDIVWTAILGEEFGEACRNALLSETHDAPGTVHNPARWLRDELVQVAAVAVAWLEALDRRYADEALDRWDSWAGRDNNQEAW